MLDVRNTPNRERHTSGVSSRNASILGDVRARAAFALVFMALSITLLLPIWRVRYLPLLDEPNHLSTIFILHHFDDPWARLHEFYELNIVFVPYISYYFLVHYVAYFVGVETASKLILSAYVLSVPLAAWAWTRRSRRSPWLSVLTFPLAYSFAWACGFHSFNVGIATYLFASCVLDSFLERPSRASGVGLLILGFLCDLAHPLAVLALGVTLPVLLVAHRPPWRRALLALGLVTPGPGLLAIQYLLPQVSWVRPTGGSFQAGSTTFLWTLKNLPSFVMGSVSGYIDVATFWVLVVVVLLLVATQSLQSGAKESEGSARSVFFEYRCGAIMAVMVALCFLVPFEIEQPFRWWFVGPRFAPIACFFGFLLPKGRIAGLRALLFAPGLVASLLLPVHISEKYAAFNERAAPFTRMVESTRAAANILFLCMGSRGDPAVDVLAYNQFAAWVQILRGGYSSAGWFDIGYPVRVKKHLTAPLFTEQERFDPAIHAGPYDYIVVRNETRPLFGADSKEWRVVAAEGEWKLYEREPAR